MYDAFYGLSKKPFQLNPDPEFFFNSAVHRRALAYLRYGLAQGEGFVVVTGMPGTGKTMLVKELFQTLRNENIVAGLMVTSQVDANDTLRIIAATFGLSYDGDAKAVLLKNLENFFKQKALEGKRVLLVVDEAQNLPAQSLEELRMLLNFELEGRSIFQVFMLGQDELRLMLQSGKMEQVRQRIVATYHLRPLEQEEAKEYILHRLTTAGWQQDPTLDEEVFLAIHEYSSGIPRIINTLCDRLFLYGYLEELHVFDKVAIRLVIDEIDQDSVCPRSISQSPLGVVMGDNFDENEENALQPVSLEERVTYVEELVALLQNDVNKLRTVLRKAIFLKAKSNSHTVIE